MRSHNNKEKSLGKEPIAKKEKQDLMKVKCFNCDNHGHLAKDYLKPLQINDCISQCKLILQGGFMAKIQAHGSEASNLLKLKCTINNVLVCCFLDLGATNLFMTLQATIQNQTELVANPITVHLAQGIVKPSFNIALSVKFSIF